MPSQRYDLDTIAMNADPFYKKYLKDSRGLDKGIIQFRTQTLRRITTEEMGTLVIESHTWKTGDRFSKLAFEHYADVQLWWVIAMFNMMPTEAFVKKGTTVLIPKPIDRVIQLMTDNSERTY